jgi:hypothetical protein
MRATGDRLDEKFIIPIARELAEGLRAIHDAGIIHRDVKAANVLIQEEGRLQICDFGVAGILQSKMDKRSTWIGTPHWMPPEMFSARGGSTHQYGSELDVWAYGCTLYEIATGNPPNAGLRERMQIGRSLGRSIPRLDGSRYTEELKDLVAFSLESDPATRPTMSNILSHPYIADSEADYPTNSLSELVRIYYQWSQRGGQRISLFHPGGAVAAEFPDNTSFDDDWNFSATDGFERRYSVLDLDQLSASLAEITEGDETTADNEPDPMGDDSQAPEMTSMEKANFDERVKRGAAAMEGLFDEMKPTYKYETKNDFVPVEEEQRYSDLPLRTTTDRSSVTSTYLDLNLGSFDSSHYAAGSASQFQLADAGTIRANRSSLRSGRNSDGDQFRTSSSSDSSSTVGDTFQSSAPRPPTMDWKFPSMAVPEDREPDPAPIQSSPATFKPLSIDKRATRDWKFPSMADAVEEPTHTDYALDETPSHTIRPPYVQSQQSALDLTLDHSRGPSIEITNMDESRPSTATSTVSDYDPFRFDRASDIYATSRHMSNTSSSSTAISSSLDGPGPDDHDDVQELAKGSVDGPGPVDHEESIIADGPGPDDDEDDDGGPGPDHHDNDSNSDMASSTTAVTPLTAHRAPLHTPRNSSGNDYDSNLLEFPDVQPPSAQSLVEDAPEEVVALELDRLIEKFMQACYSTIDAVEEVVV